MSVSSLLTFSLNAFASVIVFSSLLICSLNAFGLVIVFSSCSSSDEYRSSVSLGFLWSSFFYFLYPNYLLLCCIYPCKCNTNHYEDFQHCLKLYFLIILRFFFRGLILFKLVVSSLNLFSFLYIEPSDNSLISSISLYLTKLCLLS